MKFLNFNIFSLSIRVIKIKNRAFSEYFREHLKLKSRFEFNFFQNSALILQIFKNFNLQQAIEKALNSKGSLNFKPFNDLKMKTQIICIACINSGIILT